jgi:hypothetical protein
VEIRKTAAIMAAATAAAPNAIAALVAARRLPLVAMYAWRALPAGNLGPVTVWHYDPDEAAQEAARLLAKQLAGWSAKYPDVPVEQRPVFSFNPAETLVDAARIASLVVAGHPLPGRHVSWDVTGGPPVKRPRAARRPRLRWRAPEGPPRGRCGSRW